MTRAFVALVVAAVAILASPPATGQPIPADCSDGGVISDDGSFENGAGFQSFASRGEYVMRINPPASSVPLQTVCICWQKFGVDSQIFFNIRVFAADGAGGGPGTLLGTVPTVSASAVNSSGKFYRYDLTSLNIVANAPIYVGPEWDPGDDEDFFVCMDQNGPGGQPAYAGTSILGGAPTNRLGQVGSFPEYKALGIRARFGESTSACTASANALCLNNGRFKVEATYQTSDGQSGAAQVVKLTDETGYLWFFNNTNVEAVVKVLDACGLNQRFWVFAGGLTNVRTVITVTDTETGAIKTYTNPQSTAFLPIQDTGAFATCP